VFCHKCGSKIVEDADFCRKCGTEIPVLCGNCESKVSKDARFCQKCGSVINATDTSQSEKDAPQPYNPQPPPYSQTLSPQLAQYQQQQYNQCLQQIPPLTETSLQRQPKNKKKTESPALQKPQLSESPGGIYCPRCKSKNLQTVVETNVQGKGGGYSAGKGCLGFLLMGPFGLLCGSGGKKVKISSTNMTFFHCMDCGNKIREVRELMEETFGQSKTCRNVGVASGIIGIILLSSGLIYVGIAGIILSPLLIYASVKTKKDALDLQAFEYESKVYKENS